MDAALGSPAKKIEVRKSPWRMARTHTPMAGRPSGVRVTSPESVAAPARAKPSDDTAAAAIQKTAPAVRPRREIGRKMGPIGSPGLEKARSGRSGSYRPGAGKL